MAEPESTHDPFQLEEVSALADLQASFVFDPANADIRLGSRRMLLVDDLGIGLMRRELIQALGFDRARRVFSRIGYGIGVTDAQFAQELRNTGDLTDVYRAGPQLHALKGAVRVDELVFEADFEAGKFYGEYVWHNSAECQSHLHDHGVGLHPAGWQQVGYASGYASTFFGKPMVFREVECVAMGHERCFLIGKPADEWDNPDIELSWFRADTYSHRPQARGGSKKPIEEDLQLGSRSIVGASPQFNSVLHMVDKVAPTQAPVLFLGETGVGKEVFAKELHKRSRRAGGPMIAVNCAAIPETLMEAELFGVEKGAYTGAAATRPGRFERAAGGTLLLDEVGTLSLAAQGKLLRVLQENEFERVGGTATLKADVRIVAATNADLADEVAQGRFRADLFHRLNTFPIHIPPLRMRRADIPVLANHFLQRLSDKHAKPGMRFEAELVKLFHEYSWPGNIREMENLIERGVIVAEPDEAIGAQHLLIEDMQIGQGGNPGALAEFVATASRKPASGGAGLGQMMLEAGLSPGELIDQLYAAALAQSAGNLTKAAELAGVTRAQLQYWSKTRG